MKKKILICGATGFIGRNMAEFFARSGKHEVHAVRFSRPAYALPHAVWHQADLCNPNAVKALVVGMDIIVQAAACTSGANDIIHRPEIHVTDNAIMNSYLLRAAADAGAGHFIFFSCSSMYPSSPVPIREADFDANQPLHPNYLGIGHTKLYIEQMCDFYARISKMKCTAIRHSNIYGPYDKFDLERSHVFAATISKVLLADKSVTVWGNGEEARDLLYVDDLCHFVECALGKQKSPYRLYNCGTGTAIPISELVQKIIAASGKSLAITHDLTAPTIKTSLSLDCLLARDELGWQPNLSLDEGIIRTIDWWKKHIAPVSGNGRKQA